MIFLKINPFLPYDFCFFEKYVNKVYRQRFHTVAKTLPLALYFTDLSDSPMGMLKNLLKIWAE